MNELTKRLSAIVRAQLTGSYTSVSYALWQHGAILATDALGYENRASMQPASLSCTYNVASVSKILCTVAVMQQAERGAVSLDEPVCRYLPRFSMPLDPRYRQITLRHCLNHSSGLPGTQWRNFSVSTAQPADYYADVYDYLEKSTLKADPGAYSVYCNDGFTLAEMVVAQVTGVPFAEYCRDEITQPLGVESTRLSPVHNPAYTLVQEGKKPPEYLRIQGGGGFTTTMADLCRFGSLFLGESPVLSRESAAEMARSQGKTFLSTDEKSPLYGLGWDNVDYQDADIDLGGGVLMKGGNSFQFDTQFFVVPNYDAVLAISETHDCSLNINGLILRLFATVMLDQGVNLYRKHQPIPKEIIRRFSGVYLTPSAAFELRMDGAVADAVLLDARKKGGCVYHDLLWNGKEFEGEKNQQFLFDEEGGDRFLMTRFRTRVTGCAMKAKAFPPASPTWEARVGKRYLPCTLDPEDLVIRDAMSSLQVGRLAGFDGVYMLCFSGRADSGVYDSFESAVHPVDDSRGQCFLRTPANPSRDLLDPVFRMEDGAEVCDAASYTYRETAGLPEYQGQAFPAVPRKNGLYRLSVERKQLPDVPQGHRLMVLNEELELTYDSLFDETYQPVKSGYLILI